MFACERGGINLGNDLAGGKVFPMLEVSDNPVFLDQPDDLSKMYPEVFPCVRLHELRLLRKMILICLPLLLHLFLPMMFYYRLRVRLLTSLSY